MTKIKRDQLCFTTNGKSRFTLPCILLYSIQISNYIYIYMNLYHIYMYKLLLNCISTIFMYSCTKCIYSKWYFNAFVAKTADTRIRRGHKWPICLGWDRMGFPARTLPTWAASATISPIVPIMLIPSQLNRARKRKEQQTRLHSYICYTMLYPELTIGHDFWCWSLRKAGSLLSKNCNAERWDMAW